MPSKARTPPKVLIRLRARAKGRARRTAAAVKSKPASKFSGSLRRVGFSFGANIYGQFVNLAVQILLVPILLHAWGPSRYGVWLLLSAIPTYLTFSDFGFTLSAKNEMTIRAAKGDSKGAVVVYQSVFVLLLIVSAVVLVGGVAIVSSVRLGSFFDLGDESEREAKLVVLLLGSNVIIYQYVMLLSAGMRSAGRPATEIALTATARLFSGVVIAVAAMRGGGMLFAAAATAVEGGVFVGIFFFWVRSIAPWLTLGVSQRSWIEVRQLLHPSLSFMSQTIGFALAISGPVVILGLVATPLNVVTFSTSRTLARLGTTATNLVNASILPEYSRLFGVGDQARLRRIRLLHVVFALAVAFVFFVSLHLLGGWILFLWTRGHVEVQQPFFLLLLLSVVGEMLWTTLFIPLAAVNRHMFSANLYGVLAALGVLASYLLTPRFGLPGAIVPWIAVNLVMLVALTAQLSRQNLKLHEPQAA